MTADKPRSLLAREAARLKAAESRKLAEIEELRAQRAALEGALAAMDEALAKFAAAKGLRPNDTDDTLSDMNVDTRGKSEAVRRAAGRATRKHPAQEAFYRANVTIGQVAALLGEGRPRVSSWLAEGDAQRPIPRRHFEKLKKLYGITDRGLRIKD